MSRDLAVKRVPNAIRSWSKVEFFPKTFVNTVVMESCKLIPSMRAKNFLYRLIGMRIGSNVGIAWHSVFDIFRPDLIEIGDNTAIGYNVTVLSHEFVLNEYRVGRTRIGKNVLIGANTTILAGVTIGDNSVISASSLVNRDVPKNSFAQGNPIRIKRKKK